MWLSENNTSFQTVISAKIRWIVVGHSWCFSYCNLLRWLTTSEKSETLNLGLCAASSVVHSFPSHSEGFTVAVLIGLHDSFVTQPFAFFLVNCPFCNPTAHASFIFAINNVLWRRLTCIRTHVDPDQSCICFYILLVLSATFAEDVTAGPEWLHCSHVQLSKCIVSC